MTQENTQVSVRDELKSLSKDDFMKRTRAEMEAGATELGVEDPSSAGNKGELYDQMVAAADLPDPSLRGESEVDSPVAKVWEIADQMKAADPDVRRKDVIAAAQEQGVAFYTARTQYQSWFSATNKGTKRLADLEPADLPAALRPAEPVEEQAEQEADA